MRSIGASRATEAHRETAIRTVICRALSRYLPPIAAGILSLTLLAPFLSGVLPLLQASSASCTMSCCSGSKSCCCHTSKAPKPEGPSWTAALRCSGGCGQRAGLPGSVLIALVPSRIAVGRVAPRDDPREYAAPTNPDTSVDFALFERPPPSI
jgi:hypothetical protein